MKKFKIQINPILIFGIIVYAILIGIFIRTSNDGAKHSAIRFYIPWGFIAIFISFYIFHEYNRVKRAKRDERREYLNQRRQDILDNALKSKNKKDI
ncbi:MAG: hypothetical protein JST58_17680 [Bacteroidetes bacterium]|nr:hypothetical protein [Bacteroidota bacterium]